MGEWQMGKMQNFMNRSDAAFYFNKFKALNHNAKALLIAFFWMVCIFPGFSISAFFLLWFIFQQEREEIKQCIMAGNIERLKELLEMKRSLIKKVLKRIFAAAIAVNFLLLFLGKSLQAANLESTDDRDFFFLNFRTIQIRATDRVKDLEAMEKELGNYRRDTALIEVSAGYKVLKEIYATYEYDKFTSDDPVYVRYAFYDFDFFPDLILDTTHRDYYVSGLTGEVKQKLSLFDFLFKWNRWDENWD